MSAAQRRAGIVPEVSAPLPSVTLLLPVLNEVESIDDCLRSLAAQDYAGPLSIVVAEGGSTDGTRERLEAWASDLSLQVVENPEVRQAPGLNRAAAAATGEILVRADAHTVYEPDYVAASIRGLFEASAMAVGGSMRPSGRTPFGRAVAVAMASPLTTGPAKFHRSGSAGEVDTVYLGAFRKSDFDSIGGFRTFPSGAGEDADFYFRMRRAGGRVMLDPRIESVYRPRETPGTLLKQHFRYGQAKAELLWANRRFPSLRPLAPAALVPALVTGSVLAGAGVWWPLGILGAAWLGLLLAAALPARRLALRVAAAAALMHIGYGFGFWWGLARGPGPVRRLLRGDE